MNVADLQSWLNEHGQSLVVDGKGGPATRAAIIDVFTNKEAPAVTPADIAQFAAELGCTTKQLNAIAKVESAGGGFLKSGLPKILFERHIFWRLTEGRYGHASFSNPTYGGYGEDSWEKLCQAACRDPHAAFSSASWGLFQIMGSHWAALDYRSAVAFAYSMSRSEGDQYEALVRFIIENRMQADVQRLSIRYADCVGLARKYNGPGYARNAYDKKLAAAMA